MLLIYSYLFMSILGMVNILKKNSNFFLIISFIFLSVLIGFRNMGGSDFLLYESQYVQQFDAERWERGYIWVSQFISSFGFDYQIFILIISSFCLFILHYSIKRYSPLVIFSVVLYMALFLVYYNAIALRQMFALTFVVFSFQFIEKRQLVPFVILLCLSYFFHKSALVFILAYPFCVYYRFGPLTVSLILLMSFVLSLFDFNFLFSLLSNEEAQELMRERFLNYTETESASSITSYLKISIVLFFIFIRYKEMIKKPYFDLFVKLYFIYICLFIAFDKWSIMMRVYSYFEISYIFIIPMVVNNMPLKNIINKILLYFIVVLFFGSAYVMNILNFDNGDLLKYSLRF